MVVSACPTKILRILASDHGSSSDLEHVLLQRMNLKVRPAKTTSYPPRGKELGEDVRVAWGRESKKQTRDCLQNPHAPAPGFAP